MYNNPIEKIGDTYRQHHSLSEALEICKTYDEKEASARPDKNWQDKDSFTKTHRFGDMIQLATEGWTEGFNKCFDVATELNSSIQTGSIQPIFKEYGEEVDVGRYLSNEENCMMDYVFSSGKSAGQTTIEITYNVAASAGVESSTIENRGIVLYAVATALMRSGKSVGITALWTTKGREVYHHSVRIKEPSQLLDLKLLAFYLIHPSCLRRLFFRIAENQSKEHRKRSGVDGGSYGYPINPKETPKGVYFPCIHLNDDSKYNTKAKCKAEVIKILKDQGIKIEE